MKNKRDNIVPVSSEFDNGLPFLKWQDYGYSFGSGDNLDYYNVFIDGELVSTEYSYAFNLSNFRQGINYDVQVEKVFGPDVEIYDSSNLNQFNIVSRGDRLSLSWEENTDSDFYSYLLYYSDDGSDPTELMTELIGANKNSYTTSVLADGSYKFRLKLKDIVGNTSDYGSTFDASVNGSPAPPTGLSISYSQVTRQATLGFSAPSPLPSDFGEYRIYSNYVPEFGLLTHINYREPLTIVYDDSDYTIPFNLSVGLWQFAIRTVDESEHESQPLEEDIYLYTSGSDLLSSNGVASSISSFDAYPSADGLTVELTLNGTNIDTLEIFNGEAVLDSSSQTSTVITRAITGLTDGQTYEVKARVGYNNSLSTFSETIEVLVDATPPSSDLTITGELTE